MATAWRIAVDAPGAPAADLSGKGAERSGGRWNRRGLPVVYAASSIALACLETVVHLNAGRLPLQRYLIRIDIPDDLAVAAELVATQKLPGWDALPPGNVSLDYGDDWLKRKRSALLIVPSVIVPDEANILINPAHPDAALIRAVKLRRWEYDQRLLGAT